MARSISLARLVALELLELVLELGREQRHCLTTVWMPSAMTASSMSV
jgi:hypothetical protein